MSLNINEIITVKELNARLKDLLSTFGKIKVQGELSSVRTPSSGHMYATLKDKDSVLSIVIWRSTLSKLKEIPSDGTKVIVSGEIDLYSPRGSYQLICSGIKEVGAGDLAAKFEALKEKLSSLGLFDDCHKKEIPYIPNTIGIATAENSAAYADIFDSIKTRFPKVNIKFAPCPVQGKGAENEIIKSIKLLDEDPSVDVIICGRGGGSIEDLWSFNEEKLVHAIHEAKTPIISAVGHEIDFTLTDFVADKRAKTPTAAAEMATPIVNDIYEHLSNSKNRISNAISNMLKITKEKLNSYKNHKIFTSHEHQINLKIQKLDELEQTMHYKAKQKLENSIVKLTNLATQLNALSPLSIMSRGYSLTRNKKGESITSIKSIKPKEEINITVSDGNFSATVIEKHD